MRHVVLVGVCLLLAPSSAGAQSRLRTDVDTTVVTVGDRITMTVSVDHDASAQARLPDSLALGSFEVLAARALPLATTDNRTTSAWTLTLAAFELGELEIPSFPVEVVAADGSLESLETDPYDVRVVSVGVDESGEIRDIRGPLGIPISSLVILLWVLVPLLLAALLWVVVRRLRPGGADVSRAALGPLPRPPSEVALEALAALEASPLLERGQVKEYHIEVSDILRTYVEARFGVPALEMTTQEVLDRLACARVEDAFVRQFADFLAPCDMVKFAKVRPTPEASLAVLALGRRLVESSAPRPGPVTVEAA